MSLHVIIIRFVFLTTIVLLDRYKFAQSTTALMGAGTTTSLHATSASLGRTTGHGQLLITNTPRMIRFNSPNAVAGDRFKDIGLSSGNGSRKAVSSVARRATPNGSNQMADDGFDDLVDQVMRDADNVENAADPTTKEVYQGVLNVLAHKMQTWLSSGAHKLDAISKYLGLPEATERLIDAAFTQLLYEHRRGSVNVNDLAKAYFYSGDVKRMRDHGPKEADTVAEKFKSFLTKLGLGNEDLHTKYKESDVAENLKSVMDSIPKPVNPAFSVTIPLMKNEMFTVDDQSEIVDPAKDPTKNLKKRFAQVFGIDDVKSFEKETDADRVTENHLKVLGKMIPDIFGYVYNHFELMTALRKYESNDQRDVLAITRIQWFVRDFMEVFIKRYFEFNGEIDEAFLEAIYPLIDFLDPDNSQSERPEYSIQNYLDKTVGEECDKHMWDLMDNALEKLLGVFGNESVEEWKKNRTIRVEYPKGELDEQTILKLMNHNTLEAYYVLGAFVGNFAKGIELYKEYSRLSLASFQSPDDEFRPIDFILM